MTDYFETVASEKDLVRVNYGMMMTSASMSIISSSTLAFFIWRSKGENGFDTPYKRYLWAICLSDILQSSALLLGPLAVPKSASPDFFMAKGNIYTCTLDGIVFLCGAYGVPFYMLALCFSFLFKIKHNMKDKDFLKKYDKKIHIFVAVWTIVICTGSAWSKNIYATESGSFCYPQRPYPYGCDEDPLTYGECTHNKQGFIISFVTIFLVTISTFICIIVIMAKLVKHVVSIGDATRRRFRQSLYSPHNSPRNNRTLTDANQAVLELKNTSPTFSKRLDSISSSAQSSGGDIVCVQKSTDEGKSNLKKMFFFFKGESTSSNDDVREPLPNFMTKTQEKAKQRERDITIQALLYAASFLFVYMWPLIGSILLLFGALENKVAYFSFMIFGFTIYPMGGCFNVMVYTRQKCVIVMKRRSCSRLSAFFAVVAHGGDLPEDCKKVTRRHRAIGPQEEKNGSSFGQRFKEWKEKRQSRKNVASSKKLASSQDQEQVNDVKLENPPPKKEDPGLVDVPLESAVISNGGDDLSVDEDNFGRLESGLSLEKSSFYECPPIERISTTRRFQPSFVSSNWRASIPESFADDDLSVVTQTKSRSLVDENDC